MGEAADQLPAISQTRRAIQLALMKVEAEQAQDPVNRQRYPGLPDRVLNPDVFKGFEEITRLDHGGQGVVFKAIETATRRPVAIKVLRDGLLSSEGQRR